jgi:hypothetical protein
MSRYPALCLATLTCLLTLTVAATPSANAKDFSGTVATVPAAGAKSLIVSKVDDGALSTITLKPVAPEAKGAKDIGRASGDMKLSVELALRRSPEQQQALLLLTQKTLDPKSDMYGKTLTPEEFAKTFGLSASDLTSLSGWLTSKGLTVDNVDNGRLTIDVRGTVAQIESTFHTEIHNFQAADGSTHYAYAQGIKVPTAVAGVIQRVTGLQNFTPQTLRNFGGPVSDFAPGTTGTKISSEEAPGSLPTPKLGGVGLHDASFTASKIAMPLGGSTELNVRLGGAEKAPTGSLTVTDETGKSVAFISDISACGSYNSGAGRSCTFDYSPAAAGAHTLVARYSGDATTKAVVQAVKINATGSTTSYSVVQPSPTNYINVELGTANEVFYTVTSWAGGTQPTGTVSMDDASYPADTQGSATYPTVGHTTSSGTSTDSAGNTVSYSCTTSLTLYTVACTLTVPASSEGDNFYYVAGNVVSATYSGDSNFASSVGDTEVYLAEYDETVVPTVTPVATLTAATYGNSQAESLTSLTITGATHDGSPGYANAFPFVNIYGPTTSTLGTLATLGLTCSSTTSTTCTDTASRAFTVPALVPPGSYTLTVEYSGTNGSTSYYTQSGSTALSLTVSKQPPTMGTISFAPSSEVTQGESEAITMSATLSYTGVGAAPTGTASFVLNGMTYTGSCTGSSSPLTCSATVPAATIAALGLGTYPATGSYSGDSNYGTAAATGASLTVTSEATSGSAFSLSAASETYGSATAIKLTDVITVPSTVTALSTDTVAFTLSGGVTSIYSTTLGGGFCPKSTSGSNTVYTCTYSWTPPATASGDNAASYTVTATFSGDANVVGSSGTSSFNVTKDGTTTVLNESQSTTTSASPNVTFTTVTTYTGVGIAPTGSVTVSCVLSGVGPCASQPGTETFGASACVYSASAHTQTCTFPAFNMSGLGYYSAFSFTASYTGDTNYSSSTGTNTVEYSENIATTTVASVTSGSPVGYGTGGPVLFKVVVTGKSADGAPTGTVTLTNPTLGTIATINVASCTATNAYTYTCSYSYTVPAATAAATYTVTASYAPSSYYYASSSGTTSFVVSPAQIVFSTVSHNMGSVAVGSTSGTNSYTVKLTNNASSAFAFGGITLTGSSAFTSATNCPASVAAGASCEIGFTFAPTASGTVSATWSVSSSSGFTYSPSNGGTLTGTGIGTGSLTLTTAGHNWGVVSVGSTSPAYGVVMTNSGSTSVTLSLGSVTSPFAALTNCPATLAAGASCNFQFTFSPTATGTVSQTYSISAGGATITSGGNTVTGIVLTGTGQ